MVFFVFFGSTPLKMSFDSFYFLRSAQNLLFLYDFFLLAVYVRFILLQGGKTSMDVPSAIETFFFLMFRLPLLLHFLRTVRYLKHSCFLLFIDGF